LSVGQERLLLAVAEQRLQPTALLRQPLVRHTRVVRVQPVVNTVVVVVAATLVVAVEPAREANKTAVVVAARAI
jgi:hypothetical protein